MRHLTWVSRAVIAVVLALMLMSVASAQGVGYGLWWFTMDGGGGQSTGGAYIVSGTIGQPDTGSASGSVYSLVGGFWPGAGPDYPIYLPVIVRDL